MSLAPGTTLGPYEILAPLGAGGMGEVYRARDTKLNRHIAIKVLPEAFSQDAERLARFTREAQTLAALNHPNIAAIYGIEQNALVMELVEGRDLSEMIQSSEAGPSGPASMPGLKTRPPSGIPLSDALPIARQIAEALEAAHDHGIIHRDLKPANIKVRADGTVKVLDFGLAKAIDPQGASGTIDPSNSPTLTGHATQLGMILGTAAYMAPEQARGKAVDRRADIWAFGVVVYEMLTGARMFGAGEVSDVLAAVLRQDIDWTALPVQTPMRLRRLLERCLDRDVRQRLRDIGEARVEIARIESGASDAVSGVLPAVAIRSEGWRHALPWAVAAVAVVAAILLGAAAFSRPPATAKPLYASIDAPADHVLGEDDPIASLPTRTPMVFTADGQSLIIQAARAGRPQLFLRSLDHPDAQPIAGTDNARVPFVSPDGAWVGFWTPGELRKVPIAGGVPTTVCPLGSSLGPYGAAWSSSDVIVFGDQESRRIMRVPAGGGTPTPVTAQPARGHRHVQPFFFPDGKRILFSDISEKDAGESVLMMQSLDGGDAKLLIASATDGRLLPAGQLVFMKLGTLLTVPFDITRGEVTGNAVVAMGQVMQSGVTARNGAFNTAAGMFAASTLGHIAFVRGALVGGGGSRLVWVTPDGRSSPAEPSMGAPAGERGFIRISPDRSRAVVKVYSPRRAEVWLADWRRDSWSVCRECKDVSSIVWSSDGKRLLIAGADALVAHALDGSTPDQVMVQESGRFLVPGQWLKDGRIVYQSEASSTSREIKVLESGALTGRVVVPLGTAAAADLSPNGRWLAYQDAGEVIVQAFPGPGSKTQVSAGGGTNPVWSADSRTLYYLRRTETLASAVFAADIASSPGLTAGKPREMFRRPETQNCSYWRCFDISPDGPRFLLKERGPRVSVTRIDLVLNWTATLAKGR